VGSATCEAVTEKHKPDRSRLTQAEIALVFQLHKEGFSQVAIAQRLGCNQSTISKWLDTIQDTTEPAKAYLRGSALKMAQNIVRKGRATDHVAALKGLSVLQEDRSAGLVVQIGIKDSDVQVSLSPVSHNELGCGKDS
jgi:IS30 family transposase